MPAAADCRPDPRLPWRRGVAALGTGLLLSLGLLGTSGAAPAGGLTGASAPAPAAQAAASAGAAIDPALLALYLQSRTEPLGAAEPMLAFAETLPDADPRRVQALALAGALLAGRDDLGGAERILRQLGSLPPAAVLAKPAALVVQAALDSRRGATRRAERLFGEAVAQLGKGGPPLLRMQAMLGQARADESTGDFNGALPLRHELIALADSLGMAWMRSETRSSLAYTLLMAEQNDAAAATNAEALNIARAADDALALARAHTIDSFLRGLVDDREGERRAMLQAIAEARRAGSRSDEVLGLANLADHYLLRRDFATALHYAEQALPLSRALADRNSESVALSNIGLAQVSLHRLDEGLRHLEEARALLRRDGADVRLADLEAEAGGYLERAGYKREALAAYQRHRKLADVVAQRHQQEAVLELQERFDSARRQRELDQLQHENRLRGTRLRNQSLQQWVWIAAASAGALLLLVTAQLLRRLRRQGRRLAERNEQLRHQSERDPLTGLANRRHLLQRMQPSEGAVAPPFDGSLLLLDLDHFKRINDRHGHAAGDQVLVEVARRLRAALRDDDLIVRWGGEEFLVVTALRDRAALAALAQRLLDALAALPVALSDGPLPISGSIGFAAFPLEPTALALDWERAVDLVDSALYLAKAHGRNRAYGLEQLWARDDDELRQITRGLEAAWRLGRVQLQALRGPRAAPAATPDQAVPA